MGINQNLQKAAALQLATAVEEELNANGQPLGCHTDNIKIWGLEFDVDSGKILFPRNIANEYDKTKLVAEAAIILEQKPSKDINLETTKIYAVRAYNNKDGRLRLALAVRRNSAFTNIFGVTFLCTKSVEIKERRANHLGKFKCPNFVPGQ